jgi:hypothetical protein
MTYGGEPQFLGGMIASLTERMRALEARFLIPGPQGPQGQVGAIGPPGVTLLGSVLVTGSPVADATITLPVGAASDPGLRIGCHVRGDAAATNALLQVQINLDTSSTKYDSYLADVSGTTPAWAAAEVIAGNWMSLGVMPAGTAPAETFGATFIDIPHFSNGTVHKTLASRTGYKLANSTGNVQTGIGVGFWRVTDPIVILRIFPSAGNLDVGTFIWIAPI